MKILAIETSCDDTGIAIIEAKMGLKTPFFKILANLTHSQIELHRKWNGVVPFLAKREHAKNLVPLLEEALKKSSLFKKNNKEKNLPEEIEKLLEREVELFSALKILLPKIKIPKVDAIAVTYGPGLEPALWTGINLAKALSITWQKPLIPINHMEGHIFSSLLPENKSKPKNQKSKSIEFPVIALLISGGHTELVLVKNLMKYKILGQTRDDAVGEAFDKVARMLGLPYPGGPQISRLAEEFKKEKSIGIKFPRPMISSDDLDFSFSGLKTSVLYKIKDLGKINKEIKKEIAFEFEDSVTDVLLIKTKKAILKNKAKTLIVGGGVSANKKIRNALQKIVEEIGVKNFYLPEIKYSVDNAAMIAIAGCFRYFKEKNQFDLNKIKKIKAVGNLKIK